MDHAKTIMEVTMAKKLLAWVAATSALILTSGVTQSAEAKHGGHSGGSSSAMSHSYRMGAPYVKHAQVFKHKHVFRHHKRIIVVGYNDYGYAGDCYWLKRKALYTGSGYWWNRYYACVEAY
jgi:hypothetical protein